MGYIEDLRQQAEAAKLVALRADQKKIQERELHEQRRKQAEAFWEESGVGVLVSEVKKLFKETDRISSDLVTPKADPDSRQEAVYWDSKATGERTHGTKSGVPVSWEIFLVKSLSVEVLPEGIIVFVGAKNNRISLLEWRKDVAIIRDIFDKCLAEPAIRRYNNPDTWKVERSSGFYDGWKGGF